MQGIFSSLPTPLEIPIKFDTFLLIFCYYTPTPTPQEIPTALCGASMDIFWNCVFLMLKKVKYM